ncbi:hypothetical protein PRZ48_001535 [Zasmidium cellare]|uniref:Bromo domain-containing protein n=1 Tax=Zasmidium cellare TaxID=395010 RepID=A0ABR0F284_ZASCE|nr:hypothetical protein PRZ48_001535 [Zasmidium cellare]
MPTSYSAYTALESLLLFQGLRADGVHPSSFNKISDQLKSISLISNEPSYDSGRLSPDALRELYLDLLKEEVKEDLERQVNGDSHLTNGDVSPGSRKRKAPSPSLPTVKEAAKHSHLIPQLVTRLYARYRNHTVQKLRATETKYAQVKQQKEEIDARKWDESLLRKGTPSQTQSPRPSPKPSSSAHTQPDLARQNQNQPGPSSAGATPPVQQKQPQHDGEANAKRYSQAKIESVINHEPQDSASSHRRASSNTTLPPLSEMAPQSPRFGIPPKIPGSGPPHPSMQQMPHGAYTNSPPAGQQSPYPPQHAHPRSTSVGSPQVQQSLSRPSSSPRPILPPPKGMQLAPVPHNGSPGYPQPHHPSPQQHHYQHPPQHRMPSGPSPTGEGPPRGYPTTPLAPHPGGYYQQQPPPQYMDRRTSYPLQQTPQGQPYPNQPPPPHQGGYMLPPFQVASQDPSKPLQAIRPQQMPPHAQRPPQYLPHGHNGPATAPRPQLAPRLVSDVVSALATPPRPRIKPLWKSEYRPSPLVVPDLKPRPEIEPLSPTLERAKSPTRKTRAAPSRDPPTIEEPLQAEPASKTRKGKRRTNARDKSPHSVVSSTADERTATRSQSVSTVAGMHPASDDRPSSRGGVKAEPSTPANMLEDAEPTPAASATPATGVMTRKRRGTLQSQAQPPAKRKRQESPAAEVEDQEMATPPPRSNTIVATRNFAKVSSAVMNDIQSHKHGTYFAKEVREKDAPGYSDIVKQPQNLKSIRSAITSGARAIAAASTADSPSATPSASSTTVELERSVDLIPPKAIVNSAQLEKELMRMFANAYMFNPGEDGMALSTKEMFQDVEQTISNWRGTNREVAGDEDDESKGKRRKG